MFPPTIIQQFSRRRHESGNIKRPASRSRNRTEKLIRKSLIFVFGALVLLNCKTEAHAQILTRLQIDVSTAAGGAPVVGQTGLLSTGFFDVNFGNLNGLGIGTHGAGLTVTRQSDGALYTTPITLTPQWICIGCTTGTIKVWLDTSVGNAHGHAAAREGVSPLSVGVLPTSAATAITITTNANNSVPITRYVGLFISNTNGGQRVHGALTVRVVYRISIP